MAEPIVDNSPRAAARLRDAFGLVVESHRRAASENDVRTAFQRFLEVAGLAPLTTQRTEAPPGAGVSGRMDLYIPGRCCFEFKTDIRLRGAADPAHVDQLDGYLEALLRAGAGVGCGVLTDGVHYVRRRVGDRGVLPLEEPRAWTLHTFDRPEHAPRLREFLHDTLAAPASGLRPTPANLERHFGLESEVFNACKVLLYGAYAAHRAHPSVAVKRRLWQDLLQVALGEEAAAADPASDWLFVRHTYVTSLVAVIMQEQLLGGVAGHAAARPDALLKGRILAEESALHGVVGADLFAWPPEVGEAAYLAEIARVVERFDWTQNAREVAPTLYQNVIAPEERKRLGEYYTPRWLAREVTAAVVDDPLRQRVLDPSCGSGTFVETVMERILDASAGEPPVDTLRRLQDNVAGLDIHPVAVQLAKATWVMTAAPTIRAARAAGFAGPVSPPVYLGDSMQLRYDTGTLFAAETIELKTGEVLPGTNREAVFRIPRALARRQSDLDRMVSEMAAAVDEGGDPGRVPEHFELDDRSRADLRQVADTMRQLHAAGRNHVWAYYIRQMIRPAILAERKADRLVGNPPWLTYGQSAGVIRSELEDMCRHRYRIWAGGRYAPHQDVAALFHLRCIELYARPGAVVGMVMPHSALRAGQHLKWRAGDYRGSGPGLGLDFQERAPWDLEHVEPAFFPMPAGVVFARFVGANRGSALAPGTVQVWRGDWQADYAGLDRAVEPLRHDDGTFRSPYAQRSRQGATLVDRRLLFVEKAPATAKLAAPGRTRVKPRLGSQDRKKYAGQLHRLEGVVADDHLFDVLLGECQAPYVVLDPLCAALPARRSTLAVPFRRDGGEDGEDGVDRLDVDALDPTLQRRWRAAAALFAEEHRGQSITDLYRNLNHMGKLTRQLEYLRTHPDGVRVAYTSSGRPTAAVIAVGQTVLDSSLYQVFCESRAEAHYLVAILNSGELKAQAEQFMAKGLFGARTFQKHGWKLPVPRYTASDPLHARLAVLGAEAAAECRALVREHGLRSHPAGDAQSRPARKLLRHAWQPHSAAAQAIETAVAQLLSHPAQARRAARQRASDGKPPA